MIAERKTLAKKKDVPYRSLAKIYLAGQIVLERDFFRIALQKENRKVYDQHITRADF